MKLRGDECVGFQRQYLNCSQRMYTLVFNEGCLSMGLGLALGLSRMVNCWSSGEGGLVINDDVKENEEEKKFIKCLVKSYVSTCIAEELYHMMVTQFQLS